MKVTPGRILIVTAAVIAVFAVGVLMTVWSFAGRDQICKGVSVSGVAVGGLSRSQASAKIEAWAIGVVKRQITLTALDARWTGSLADFGARVDVKDAVARAYDIGRSSGILGRTQCVLTSGGPGKHLRIKLLFADNRLKGTIAAMAKEIDRPHRDASIREVNGRLETRQDSCGIKVNREKALGVVSRALSSGLAVVSLPVEVDKPDITAADAARIDTLLARHVTSFNPGKRDRTYNLVLAARALNGLIVKPGGVFSYNGMVGPRLQSRGFRNAIIFVRGKQEPGLGGGICQVSSTLYNAVLYAGLKVKERSHHSRTVPYVPAGRDATVSYGVVDFRFENSNSAPICVLTKISGARLTVDLYGAAADKKQIQVFTRESAHMPAGTKTIADPSLRPGQRKLVEPGSRGVSVTVYRKVTSADGAIRTEVVSRDRYAPQAAVIGVGPGVKSARNDAESAQGVLIVPAAAEDSGSGQPDLRTD